METGRYLISYVSRIIFLLLFIIIACKKHASEQTNKKFSHQIEFENPFVLSTINNYIKKFDLDSSKSIISINVETNSSDTTIYINRILNRDFKKMPSYYTVVSGHVVFIYTDVEFFLKESPIKDEVFAFMAERKITLESDKMINDSPTLRISKCEDKIYIERDVDVIELPCYLKITVENGQLKLIKKD